ncbi:RDD family protein [Actinomadura sp. DC4]|uniref:RDD family protein n=1 Tax=Actinomadura sp. DC4 TaxID=3055069 RepID=UPI0025B204F0|nr:RDD family protein [Actinomadura sp. DC4]MDN3358789.1 RDD family protein [Actinomadura sp. DC4]
MTQSPDHPEERERSQGPPPQAPPPPPAATPYPSAPPISEPYGNAPPTGITADLAGRWARLFAAIIDGIITNIISIAIAAPLVGGGAMFSAGTKDLGHRLAADGITAIIAIVYYTFQHGKWGQTIGKRALGIRVVRSQDEGPISYGTAAWRVVFEYLLAIITFGIGGLLDIAWILWDPRKQALHDKVAKTYVVKADGPDPYAGT